MCGQRLARVLLFGCLLTVLGGGAPLLQPRAVQAVGQPIHAQAAQAAPALVWTALPLSSRQHDGDGGNQCSVAWLTCDQSPQQCIEQAPIVHVVPVPVVKVVKVVQVVTVEKKVFVQVPVEKKVFVPVPVEKVVKVFVPVPVEKVVKVFVPVPVVATPTSVVKVVVPVLPPATPTPAVKVIVLPPATPTPTPMVVTMPPGDPMF